MASNSSVRSVVAKNGERRQRWTSEHCASASTAFPWNLTANLCNAREACAAAAATYFRGASVFAEAGAAALASTAGFTVTLIIA
jgi:hypothetical protein